MSADPMPIPGIDMTSLASVYRDHGYRVHTVSDHAPSVDDVKTLLRDTWKLYTTAKSTENSQPKRAVLFTPHAWQALSGDEIPTNLRARAEELRLDGARYGVPVEVTTDD